MLLTPAEKAGAPILTVWPLVWMLSIPVTDSDEVFGTEKLKDCPVVEAIVRAPPATDKWAVPLV